MSSTLAYKRPSGIIKKKLKFNFLNNSLLLMLYVMRNPYIYFFLGIIYVKFIVMNVYHVIHPSLPSVHHIYYTH